MQSRPGIALLAGVTLLLCVAHPLLATTIHVPSEQPTILDGIQAAVDGDTVLVACGIYHEHDLLIDKEICVRSEIGQPDCVTIDAQQQGRVFACVDVADGARIEGLTITGGLVPPEDPFYRGGGIACIDAAPRVSDCVIEANEAEVGGSGMYCQNSSPTVARCDFVRNVGAVDGGGLYATGTSAPDLSYCTMIENEAQFWGGAIFCNLASVTVTHCTLVKNEAHWGGGFWCVGSPGTIFENSIVALSEEGEGIYVYDNPSFPSTVEMICSDVHGNVGGEYGGAIEDPTGTNGNISEYPRFCNPDEDDYTLSSISPCAPENNSCNVQMGALEVACTFPAGQLTWSPPARFATWNAPNPFNPTTRIHFELPRPSRVLTLRIYDAEGRLVRDPTAEMRGTMGRYHVTWDGRDTNGVPQASGVYFYRIETDTWSATRKMTLIR